MPSRTLEDELIQLFASSAQGRNREILIGYYGWGDGQCHTLAEVGIRYHMTRERTRQICSKLVRRANAPGLASPVTDRTLAFLARRLPAPAERLEQDLRQAGLTRVGLRLEHVRTAAELLGREVPFRLIRVEGGRLAVRPEQAAIPSAVIEAARKEIYYHGLSTVAQVRQAVEERFPGAVDDALVAESLPLADGFSWLDRDGGWFRLECTSKHGLPKAIEKALSVAGRLPVGVLRGALGRNRRMWQVLPSDQVLLEYCRQSPALRVEGETIRAVPARDWRDVLTGVEARLVEILKRRGPVMERGALEDLCVAAGMNRFSFHAFIACSPVIAQYGHSVYGLLGADVPSAEVDSLIQQRRRQRSPRRVLDRHGRHPDGRLWLSYRLSKAASTYAVITIPAELKATVTGRFGLVTPDGRQVGTLAAKDGRAWGLGAYLRRQEARINDRVLITLDLETRTAVIHLGAAAPGDAAP